MSIRLKFTIVLFLVALIPLSVVAWIATERTKALGDRLSDRDRALLEEQLTNQVARLVGGLANELNQDKIFIETALLVLTEALQRRLSGETAPGPSPWFKGQEPPSPLTPSLHHFRMRPDKTPEPISVNHDHPVFEGGHPDHPMVGRLSGLSETLRTLAAAKTELVFWQKVALAEGLSLTYPGHAGPDVVARESPWYQAAEAVEGSVWTAPYADPVTGALVIALSRAVRDEAGRVLAVAAIKVRILPRLAQAGAALKDLASAAETYIVDIETRENTPAIDPAKGRALRILVGDAYEDQAPGQNGLARLRLPADDPRFDQMADDMAAGLSGLRRLPFEGRDSLWAFAPVDGIDTHVLVVAPFQDITRRLAETEEAVRQTTAEQLARIGAMMALAAALALIIALMAGRLITRRVQSLAEAAGKLAKGDLTARALVRGRDEIARLAGAFNDMVPKLRDRLAVRESLEVARSVQQSLLPAEAPAFPGFDLAGACLYCDETGGDYFDFVGRGENGLAVVMGDVTGHGLPAALTMTSARSFFRALGTDGAEPGAVLTRLNRLLAADARQGRFMTFCLVHLTAGSGDIRFANAGADPIIVAEAGDGSISTWDQGDPPLAVDAGLSIASFNGQLGPGDVLLMATDGVAETRNRAGEMFGEERLRRCLSRQRTQPAAIILESLTGELKAFRGDAEQKDDITIVVIKRV
ncbi:MAG: SpoIIE family protein phosphatase [Magnetovibrionaceae bacterium]